MNLKGIPSHSSNSDKIINSKHKRIAECHSSTPAAVVQHSESDQRKCNAAWQLSGLDRISLSWARLRYMRQHVINSNPKPKSFALCPAIRLLINGRALDTQRGALSTVPGIYLIRWLCHRMATEWLAVRIGQRLVGLNRTRW